MGNLSYNTYIKENATKDWLLKNGFRHNKILSSEHNDVFIYHFSVYKYGKFSTLECEITVYAPSGAVTINVYDYNTRYKYAPFYREDCCNNLVLESINKKIEKKLESLGIKECSNFRKL